MQWIGTLPLFRERMAASAAGSNSPSERKKTASGRRERAWIIAARGSVPPRAGTDRSQAKVCCFSRCSVDLGSPPGIGIG
jgi:hypothetical protein